jgi:tetratricopeptide (TPR) repeat protein
MSERDRPAISHSGSGSSTQPADETEAALLARLAASASHDERRHLTLELVVHYSRTDRQALAMARLRGLLDTTSDPVEQADYLLGLGQLMEQLGDFSAASVFYEEGLALGTGQPQALYLLHNNLGYCLNACADHRRAEEHCRAAIAIDGHRHNAYKNLAVALAGQGHYAEAAELYVRAVQLNPGDARALRHLEQLVAEHGDAIAGIPLLQARVDECRAQVDAARRRLLARLSG